MIKTNSSDNSLIFMASRLRDIMRKRYNIIQTDEFNYACVMYNMHTVIITGSMEKCIDAMEMAILDDIRLAIDRIETLINEKTA